jgi:hypothetical protein
MLSSLIHISLFLYCPLFHFGVCWCPLWVPLFVSMSSHVLYFWCLEISWVHLDYILVNHLLYLLIFFMNIAVICPKISSLRVFLWVPLGSWVSFIIVLLGSGAGYPFSSFHTESCIELCFWIECFPSLLLPIAPLDVVQLCSW